MTDIQRSQSYLLTQLFQDGQDGGISAQDIRDLIISMTPDHEGLSFVTPANTTIAVAGTYVKAAGVTELTNGSNTMDSGGTSNRLRYLGVSPRHFRVVFQASVVMASGNNQDISIQLYHYDASAASGSLVAHSQVHNTVPGQFIVQMTAHADLTMDTDDYIEMHITNNDSTNAVRVEYGYMSAFSTIT